MARFYKRDRIGRFSKTGGAGGKKKAKARGARRVKAGKFISKHYQRGHSGAGAQYRRRVDRYYSHGYYSKNKVIRKGKRPTGLTRGARKFSAVMGVVPTHPMASANLVRVGVSAYRDQRARQNGFAA